MQVSEELSFEQQIKTRIRLLEANVGLALNYVRAIAKENLPARRVRELEDEYEQEIQRLQDELSEDSAPPLK